MLNEVRDRIIQPFHELARNELVCHIRKTPMVLFNLSSSSLSALSCTAYSQNFYRSSGATGRKPGCSAHLKSGGTVTPTRRRSG